MGKKTSPIDKKTLGIIALLGAVAGGIAVAAAAAAKEEVPPPPLPPAKYTCVWKDGFTADTWEEMLEHYRTVHPGMQILEFVEIQWV